MQREGHFNSMSASVSFLTVNTLQYQYKEQSVNVYIQTNAVHSHGHIKNTNSFGKVQYFAMVKYMQ